MTPPLRLLFAPLLSLASLAYAQEDPARTEEAAKVFGEAMAGVQADIEADTQRLVEFRNQVDAERATLVEEIEAINRRIRAKQDALTAVRKRLTGARARRRETDAAVAAHQRQFEFLETLLIEHRRALETRIHSAESAATAEELTAADNLLKESQEPATLADAVEALLGLSEELCRDRLGGLRVEGPAVDEQGHEREGAFAILGPVAYFAEEDGGLCGPAIAVTRSALPGVIAWRDEASRSGIRSLVEGESAVVPVDTSGGDALKVAETETDFFGHVAQGGIVMVPLLLLGGVAAAMAVWKTLALFGVQVVSDGPVERAMECAAKGDVSGAESAAAPLREPLRTLVGEAVRHRNSTRGQLEEILHEHILSVAPRLERSLGALAVFGGVAPLLGLLGTVTGMIHTFRLVTVFGAGDAKLLSGGISEALVTTEFGLAIAIPVLLVHAYLTRRVRSMIGDLEQTAVRMVNRLDTTGEGQ